jgi:ABC-type dipeptide/oligopeptide/nickel transport system permease subunit
MAKPTRVRRRPIPTRKYPPRQLVPVVARRPPWYRMPGVIVGAAFLLSVFALAFVLPRCPGFDPIVMDVDAALQAPSREHWLGTDQFGRDVWCRIVFGGRISLPVGVLAVVMAALPGVSLGLIAGFYRGWTDVIIGRLTDVLLAFPGILLALLIVAWLGPGLENAVLAIGVTGIPSYVRLTRSRTLQLERAWFVRAARTVGCTDARILLRHILPNVLPAIIALGALDVAWAILNAATLSFLGLGAQPPTPDWGAMINEGRGFLRQAPWISLAPGLMMTLTVLAVNGVGDGLREALDPKSR